MRRLLLIPVLLLPVLSGCDMLGIETGAVKAAKRESEGKAIGAACRHAGRAIEDCYTLNLKADKGAVYTGWREMNDYMVENKIEVVKPMLPHPSQAASAPKPAASAPPAKPKADAEDEDEDTADTKPAARKPAAKH